MMYFAIYRFDFHPQYDDPNIFKYLSSLCQKLSKQYKVVAKPFRKNESSNILSIGVSCISESPNSLEQLADKMAESCEKSELGRLYSSDYCVESFSVLDDSTNHDTEWLDE